MKNEQWHGSEQLEKFIKDSESTEEYVATKPVEISNSNQIARAIILGAILICLTLLIIAARCKCNCM